MADPSYLQEVAKPTELWESTAKKTVLEALHRQQTATFGRWRTQWRDLHAFYDGEHAAQMRDLLKVTHPERSREWGATEQYRYAPIVRAWVERVSMIFHTPPETYLHRGDGEPLDESDPAAIQWRKDSKQINLNQMLSQIESWTNLLGQCFVQPSWIGPRGEMRWQVHTPYEVWIEQDPTLPDESEGAYVTTEIRQPLDTIGAQPRSLFSSWRQEAGRWYNWITDERGRLMQNPLWADNISRYERPGSGHPFVVFRRENPAPGLFFIPPDESLLKLQLSTNTKLINLDHILNYQVHATGIITGMMLDDGATAMGPSRVLEFPDRDGDFKYVSPSPNLAEFRECFKFDLRLAAVCAGMSPTEFEPSVTRNLAAKQLENYMLKAKREKAIPAYLTAVAKLWESHKMVGNYWADQTGARYKYPEGLELGVKLAPIPEVFDRFQDTQATIQEINNGLTSAVESIQRREGCTRAEALRRVKQRMQDTQELKEQAEPAEPAQELRADSASPGMGVRRSPSVERGD